MVSRIENNITQKHDELQRPSPALKFLSRTAPHAMGAAIMSATMAVGAGIDEALNTDFHIVRYTD